MTKFDITKTIQVQKHRLKQLAMNKQELYSLLFSARGGWLFGLITTLLIVFTTGLADFTHGYSPDVAYRLQTEAFFKGDLSVRSHPMQHEHDMVWARNGLQQPWGLGVPVLRMPFELAARLVGVDHFPDRWVLVFYMFLGISFLVRGLQSTLLGISNLNKVQRSALLLVGTMVSVASPMLIGMFSGRVVVYEEAIAYLLFFQWALLGMLLLFAAKLQWCWFVTLCLCAGFAAIIRPTGAFSAVITVLCALVIAWRYRVKSPITILYVVSLFCVLPLVLMLLNYIRFESAFSFGQFQPLAFLPIFIYVVNFADPFQAVSLFDAAKELFGTLFFLDRIAELEQWEGLYPSGWHAWEAPMVRMREYYFESFPAYYLLLLMVAWGVLINRWGTLTLPVQIAAAWSIAGFLFLFGFYMYTPVITSRYLIDFIPQVLTPIVLLLIVMLPMVYSRLAMLISVKHWHVSGLFVLAALLVQAIHFVHAQNFIPQFYVDRNKPVSFSQTGPALQPKNIQFEQLPRQYVCGEVAHNYGIANNTWNWNPHQTGDGSGCNVSVVTTLFFPPFQCITVVTLDMPFAINGVQFATDSKHFRMRSGHFELIQAATEKTGANRSNTTFCLPNDATLHHRWNQVIIGWVPPEYLKHKTVAPLKLLGVYITR